MHVHSDGQLHLHGQPDANPVAPTAGAPFSFGAAGDYAFSGDAQSVMTTMGNSGLDFAIALGDTTYGATSESNWCDFFESKMGDGKVLLIAGNHDTGESGGGNINTLRQYCNFGISATLTGDYGKEYYFDYPQTEPLARFILTGCGVSFEVDGQGKWDCDSGDSHYNFVANAIDGARSASIPWVFVGMHKNCITNGVKDCEIGEAFQDLLLSKRVDVVMQAHDHNYQRSKQLTCADDDNFRAECVADSDDSHDHGAGEVINIAGTGGQGLYETGGTADEPYFTKWNSNTKGFLQVDVTESALTVRFKNVVGSFTDWYEIKDAGPPSPDFSISANPTAVTFPAGGSATSTITIQSIGGFTGTVDLTASSTPSGVSTSCNPSSITGGSGTSICTFTASNAGVYTVTITGTSGTLVHSATVAVAVIPPGPTARFTFSPALPRVNSAVSFDASSSTDTDPSATLEARWDWEGDGTWDTPYSSTLTAQHTFTAGGTYPVELEIRDSLGLTDTEGRAVVVLDLGSGEVGAPPGYGLTDPSRLQARGPIFIGSNAGFTAANGVRRGTGTAADPYVISDWLIDGSLYPGTQAMIHLESTDAYVVIENNKIINLEGSNHWEAIQLGHWPAIINTQHVAIRHNHIENARHAYGIAIREGSRDITVEANYVHTNANFEWVHGIATDRNVHDVTIFGNYVNAYTSGNFHTTGIHISDTHIDDSRRATNVVALRNTVVNATAGGIVSLSSSGTRIEGNLVYMDYPGPKSVGPNYPRGIITEQRSEGTMVLENTIHSFHWGIEVGADHGWFVSNTISEADYAIYVVDNGTIPGATSFDETIYDTSYSAVTSGGIHLPANFRGTVVDLGLGVRTTDMSQGTLTILGAATQVSFLWTGSQLNLSVTANGFLMFDTITTSESQSLLATWSGSIMDFDVTSLHARWVAFQLQAPDDVSFTGVGFAPGETFTLNRTDAGGTTTVLSTASTPGGSLAFTIPAAAPSAYGLEADGFIDSVIPTSTLGISGTSGTNGWYVTVVQVTLTAASPSGSAVSIRYSLDRIAWMDYTAPFAVGEGTHTFQWQAFDAEGHRETIQSMNLAVDMTKPTVTDLSPTGRVTNPDGVVSWTGFDGTSGIAWYEVSIDGGAFGPIGDRPSLAHRWTDGPHTVAVKAIDNAGHESLGETSFVVESGTVSFPIPLQAIPLYFPAMGLALLVLSFVLLRRRHRKERSEWSTPTPSESDFAETDFSNL
jgi:hypothetical protein